MELNKLNLDDDSIFLGGEQLWDNLTQLDIVSFLARLWVVRASIEDNLHDFEQILCSILKNYISEKDIYLLFNLVLTIRTEWIFRPFLSNSVWEKNYFLVKQELLSSLTQKDISVIMPEKKNVDEFISIIAEDLRLYVSIKRKWIIWFIELLEKSWRTFLLFKYVLNSIGEDDKNTHFSINATVHDILDNWFISSLEEKVNLWYNPDFITIELIENLWPTQRELEILEILRACRKIWFHIAMDDYPDNWSNLYRLELLLKEDGLLTGLKIDLTKTKSLYSIYEFSLNYWLDFSVTKEFINFKSEIKEAHDKWVRIIFEYVADIKILEFLINFFWSDIDLQWFYFKIQPYPTLLTYNWIINTI